MADPVALKHLRGTKSAPPPPPVLLTTEKPLTAVCRGRVTHRATHKSPVLLWSFPGSGNTYVRVLIELATGMQTGSPYHDQSLYSVLPGEALDISKPVCGGLAVIKAHAWDGTKQNASCLGAVDRAILLVRHPLAAIWSDYQRQQFAAERMIEGGHNATLARVASDWAVAAADMANQYAMLHGSRQLHPPCLRPGCKCGTVRQYDPCQWYSDQLTREDAIEYTDWQRDPSKRSTYLRYEDLVDPARREAALRAALRFAGFEVAADRIACAFTAADDVGNVHRASSGGLTATQAFRLLRPTERLAIWKEVSAAATPLGYAIDSVLNGTTSQARSDHVNSSQLDERTARTSKRPLASQAKATRHLIKGTSQ